LLDLLNDYTSGMEYKQVVRT